MLLRLAAFVTVAYKLSSGGRFTVRGVVAFALAAGGTLAAVDGFLLGVKEEGRTRYGHVRSGFVVEKFSSAGADGSRPIGPSGGHNQRQTMPVITGDGFAFYDTLARVMVSGSPQAWVVDYRFPCTTGRTCFGRDFVTAGQWSSLHAGETVNVRQADWETVTSRLDDNPQWSIALADFAIGALLLVGAGLASNRLVLFRRRPWLTAPAVVTAVEPVQYGDDVRWRIRFAYFDRDGVPQESADQVVPGKWKSGDSCIAVYRPEKPDLATLQPASH